MVKLGLGLQVDSRLSPKIVSSANAFSNTYPTVAYVSSLSPLWTAEERHRAEFQFEVMVALGAKMYLDE